VDSSTSASAISLIASPALVVVAVVSLKRGLQGSVSRQLLFAVSMIPLRCLASCVRGGEVFSEERKLTSSKAVVFLSDALPIFFFLAQVSPCALLERCLHLHPNQLRACPLQRCLLLLRHQLGECLSSSIPFLLSEPLCRWAIGNSSFGSDQAPFGWVVAALA
jgi:hypothetical protein